MKIDLVQLENIRSHVKSTVPFARGFNCLVGGLGCGKSSILYTIDFALFGDPLGRSFEYLLREGASAGKVTVQFTHNGKTYTISRGLRRRGKGINQDSDALKLFEEENLISGVKNEAVAEQLKAATGLDKELFREIVWVRQEHLKEFLDVAPRERQKRLDDLFGLSDYETAWSSLAGYQKEYEGEKRAYEKDPDVVGMDKLGRDYDKAAEEFSVIELEMQEAAKKAATARKALEEAESKLKRLEEVRTQNEKLRQKETELHTKQVNIQEAVASMSEDFRARKDAIESSEKRLSSMETQADSYYRELRDIGIRTDQSTEALRRSVTIFDDKVSSLKGEQEALRRTLQTDEKRISSLAQENLCPLCLQNLTEEYKSDLVQRIQEENGKRQTRADQLTIDILELQKLRNKGNVALSNLQSFLPRIDDLKTRIKEEKETLVRVADDIERKRTQEQEMHLQLTEVQKELEGFDVSRLETARTLRDESFKQYHLLESDLRLKENRKKDLTKRLDEIKERIDQAQQKIERMQKIAKAFEVIGVMRDAYRSIQPKLRSEFVKILRNFVQQVLDSLVGGEGALLNMSIDETYTPFVISEGGVERDASNLSGGERTLLAFAYRLGLGQLIMQSRTGHGLSMLLLDEPTESLGREDGSIDRLAEAISRFKAIEQTIAVTHSDAFAEKAEHVIRLEKEAGISKITVEK
jgi:exonuclease SbcC